MSARAVFLNAQGAIRAPWRLGIFVLVLVAAEIVFATLAATVAGDATPGGGITLRSSIAFSWAFCLAALVAHLVSVRWVERRPWTMVGLHRAAARPRPLLGGALVGALAIGVPSALLLATGLLRVERVADGSWLQAAAVFVIFLAPAALAEELVFRGYPFAVLREVWGARVALVVTSVAFGLIHIGNQQFMSDPGELPRAIAVVMLAGVFLGAVLLATGSLYAAWTAHFAWNWVLAGLLHAALSGVPFAMPDYRVVEAGPDWLTGGGWGPEGGAAAGLGMVSGLIYLYVRRARREES